MLAGASESGYTFEASEAGDTIGAFGVEGVGGGV